MRGGRAIALAALTAVPLAVSSSWA